MTFLSVDRFRAFARRAIIACDGLVVTFVMLVATGCEAAVASAVMMAGGLVAVVFIAAGLCVAVFLQPRLLSPASMRPRRNA